MTALKYTAAERAIAKSLGVSVSGLALLAQKVAGKSHQRGSESGVLASKGLIEGDPQSPFHAWKVTEAGRAVVTRARQMGW